MSEWVSEYAGEYRSVLVSVTACDWLSESEFGSINVIKSIKSDKIDDIWKMDIYYPDDWLAADFSISLILTISEELFAALIDSIGTSLTFSVSPTVAEIKTNIQLIFISNLFVTNFFR